MILLTGATGTVGGATLKALLAKGVTPTVALRDPAKAAALGAPGVRFDWADPTTWSAALAGATSVLMLQGTEPSQPEQTRAFLDAARGAGVQRIVRLSVAGAQSPTSHFSRIHAESDAALQASGIRWTILRPTTFSQNWFNYYGVSRANGGTAYVPNGDAKLAFVDAADIGEVAAAALLDAKHEGHIYDLTGPASLTMAEAAAVLGEALGTPVSYVAVPQEAATKAMRERGMPEWLVTAFGELSAAIRDGGMAPIRPGVPDALGHPARTFAEFARDAARG